MLHNSHDSLTLLDVPLWKLNIIEKKRNARKEHQLLKKDLVTKFNSLPDWKKQLILKRQPPSKTPVFKDVAASLKFLHDVPDPQIDDLHNSSLNNAKPELPLWIKEKLSQLANKTGSSFTADKQYKNTETVNKLALTSTFNPAESTGLIVTNTSELKPISSSKKTVKELTNSIAENLSIDSTHLADSHFRKLTSKQINSKQSDLIQKKNTTVTNSLNSDINAISIQNSEHFHSVSDSKNQFNINTSDKSSATQQILWSAKTKNIGEDVSIKSYNNIHKNVKLNGNSINMNSFQNNLNNEASSLGNTKVATLNNIFINSQPQASVKDLLGKFSGSTTLNLFAQCNSLATSDSTILSKTSSVHQLALLADTKKIEIVTHLPDNMNRNLFYLKSHNSSTEIISSFIYSCSNSILNSKSENVIYFNFHFHSYKLVAEDKFRESLVPEVNNEITIDLNSTDKSDNLQTSDLESNSGDQFNSASDYFPITNIDDIPKDSENQLERPTNSNVAVQSAPWIDVINQLKGSKLKNKLDNSNFSRTELTSALKKPDKKPKKNVSFSKNEFTIFEYPPLEIDDYPESFSSQFQNQLRRDIIEPMKNYSRQNIFPISEESKIDSSLVNYSISDKMNNVDIPQFSTSRRDSLDEFSLSAIQAVPFDMAYEDETVEISMLGERAAAMIW